MLGQIQSNWRQAAQWYFPLGEWVLFVQSQRGDVIATYGENKHFNWLKEAKWLGPSYNTSLFKHSLVMLLQRLFLHWLHHCLAIVCHCKPSSSIDPFNWENLPKITSQLKAHLGIYQLLSFHYILSYSFTIFSGFSQNKWHHDFSYFYAMNCLNYSLIF